RALFPGSDLSSSAKMGTRRPARLPHCPTLEELARDKALPIEFLRSLGLRDLDGRQGVAIPYMDAAGAAGHGKRRTALVAKEGSLWPRGVPLMAYGQERLADAREHSFLVLVEGESDAWTLWYHGLPALGIPGANATKTCVRNISPASHAST